MIFGQFSKSLNKKYPTCIICIKSIIVNNEHHAASNHKMNLSSSCINLHQLVSYASHSINKLHRIYFISQHPIAKINEATSDIMHQIINKLKLNKLKYIKNISLINTFFYVKLLYRELSTTFGVLIHLKPSMIKMQQH